jgi:hypothetical protein
MTHPEVSEKGSPQIQGGISEAAKAKADNLLVGFEVSYLVRDAFARFIQEVSDVSADITKHGLKPGMQSALSDFILPDPVDPLVAALREALPQPLRGFDADDASYLISELAKRGLEIRERQS